jgi:ribosomal protein S18 acetylase RimI-like enzyme
MLRNIGSKIARNYHSGGLLQVVRAGISRITRFVFNTNNAYWFRMDLTKEISAAPLHDDVTVRCNEPEITTEYIRQFGYYYPEEIDVGISTGHLFSNLRYQGNIIGYNTTGYINVYIQDFKQVYAFPRNVAFTYHIFIDPKYRNRNLGFFLLAEICRVLKNRGYVSMWAHIPPWNKPSIAMHTKLGFQQQGMIRFYSLFGLSWTTKEPIKFIRYVEEQCRQRIGDQEVSQGNIGT